MAIDPELIDKLLADCRKPEQIIGEEGLLKQLFLPRRRGVNGPWIKGSRTPLRRPFPKGDFGEIELEICAITGCVLFHLASKLSSGATRRV